MNLDILILKIMGYPQKMRLQSGLCGIFNVTVRFLTND